MNAEELRRELDLARTSNRSDRVAEILAELDGLSRDKTETTQAEPPTETAEAPRPARKTAGRKN